jgi:hypothetical protein
LSNKTIRVLDKNGKRLCHATRSEAEKYINDGIAERVSQNCIRWRAALLPEAALIKPGAEWRPKQSGEYGPIVRQMEQRF